MICPHCQKEIEEKTFIIHWRDETTSKITGHTITDACRKAGIGGGAVAAIDYYEEEATL